MVSGKIKYTDSLHHSRCSEALLLLTVKTLSNVRRLLTQIRKISTIPVISSLFLVSGGQTSAQDSVIETKANYNTGTAAVTGRDEAGPERLEEIIVVGEQSFIAIRSQIERAEDRLYSLFNDLNSRDDFDIVCRTIQTTNSNIPRRICEPVFFSELRRSTSRFALSELRQAWSEDGIDIALADRAMDYIPEEAELREMAATTFEQLQEEMLRLAEEHPGYLQALLQVGELKALLQRERQQRFKVDSRK